MAGSTNAEAVRTADGRVQARRLLEEAVVEEAPRYMAVAAVITAVFSAFNAFYFGLDAAVNSLDSVAVGVLALASVVVSRVPIVLAPWVVVVAATVTTNAMLAQVYLDPTQQHMGYVLLLLVACAPFILVTIPVFAWSVVQLLACFLVVARLDESVDWYVLCAAALTVGGVLARARADATVRAGRSAALVLERADQDDLTGLLNRRGLERRWPTLVAAASRRNEQVVAVFVDVDGFKQVNDRFGHERGDLVLQAVAASIRSSVRADDLVTRWGGDEFLVVGSGTAGSPVELAERVRDRVAQVGEPLGLGRISISTGSASGSATLHLFDDLVRQADADMYRRRRDARGEC